MRPGAVAGELARMFPLRWTMSRTYRLPSNVLGEPYYIEWNPAPRPRGEGWVNASFDERGVLVSSGFRNPVQLSQFAFYNYAAALDGDPAARERFLAQAGYLLTAQRSDGGYPYAIAAPAYRAEPGWLSGMAQGEAASVLLRAYALTGDSNYLNAGLRSLQPLLSDVRSGGAAYLRDEDVFFEEVATPDPCHILNGHIFAAFAVWEFARHSLGGTSIAALHEGAVATLERWLERYDEQGWSTYDLAVDGRGRRHFAPLWYHHFHIAQLRVYAAMTARTRFAEMAERWNDALGRWPVRARVWRYNGESLVAAVLRRARRAPVQPFRLMEQYARR